MQCDPAKSQWLKEMRLVIEWDSEIHIHHLSNWDGFISDTESAPQKGAKKPPDCFQMELNTSVLTKCQQNIWRHLQKSDSPIAQGEFQLYYL